MGGKSENYTCYVMDALMDCAKDRRRLYGDEDEVNKARRCVRFSLIDDYIICRIQYVRENESTVIPEIHAVSLHNVGENVELIGNRYMEPSLLKRAWIASRLYVSKPLGTAEVFIR